MTLVRQIWTRRQHWPLTLNLQEPQSLSMCLEVDHVKVLLLKAAIFPVEMRRTGASCCNISCLRCSSDRPGSESLWSKVTLVSPHKCFLSSRWRWSAPRMDERQGRLRKAGMHRSNQLQCTRVTMDLIKLSCSNNFHYCFNMKASVFPSIWTLFSTVIIIH